MQELLLNGGQRERQGQDPDYSTPERRRGLMPRRILLAREVSYYNVLLHSHLLTFRMAHTDLSIKLHCTNLRHRPLVHTLKHRYIQHHHHIRYPQTSLHPDASPHPHASPRPQRHPQ